MTIAVYPGSFDPITNGHADLAMRGARLFDRLIIGIARNSSKTGTFSIDQRLHMAREVLAEVPNIEVTVIDGLLVDFVARSGASVILRGLRAVSDFEYEFQLATMNRHLATEIETLFLTPAEQYSFISSSLVREIARFGGDVSVFVHTSVAQALREAYAGPVGR